MYTKPLELPDFLLQEVKVMKPGPRRKEAYTNVLLFGAINKVTQPFTFLVRVEQRSIHQDDAAGQDSCLGVRT